MSGGSQEERDSVIEELLRDVETEFVLGASPYPNFDFPAGSAGICWARNL